MTQQCPLYFTKNVSGVMKIWFLLSIKNNLTWETGRFELINPTIPALICQLTELSDLHLQTLESICPRRRT